MSCIGLREKDVNGCVKTTVHEKEFSPAKLIALIIAESRDLISGIFWFGF